MQLTMMGEYAVRAMIHLSALPFGTIVHISDVSKEWSIPENFLRKISAQLAGAELITSQRGVHGGIRLGRRAESMTVLEVIEAVEGKMFLNRCLIHEGLCPRDEWCQVHTLWTEAQSNLHKVLSGKNLAQLATESLNRRALVDETRQQTSAA